MRHKCLNDFTNDFKLYCTRKGSSVKTLANYQTLIPLIENTVGKVPLQKLTLNHDSYIIEPALGRGKSVPQRVMVVYRRLLKYITIQGYKLNFYWRDVEIPKCPRSQLEVLSMDEIRYLRNTLDVSRPAELRTRVLFELLLHTGLRTSEALAINKEDINFETEEIDIINCKTHENETIYIHGCTYWLKRYIRERNDNSPALFVNQSGQRLTPIGAKTYLRLLRDRLSMQKHLNHKIFRKTFTTVLLLNNVDIKTVQVLARHRDERTTLRHYAVVTKQRCKLEHQRVMSEV